MAAIDSDYHGGVVLVWLPTRREWCMLFTLSVKLLRGCLEKIC